MNQQDKDRLRDLANVALSLELGVDPKHIFSLLEENAALARTESSLIRQNLEIADNLGFDRANSKDGLEFSVEEWAAHLAKKAARYDYIRNNGHYVVKCGGESLHCGGHVNISNGKFPQAMDDAIDAAMQHKGD